MVKAIVDIEDNANRILNIVKAKENLNDKSDALNLILNIFGKEMLEPELKPDFIKELLESQKEKTIKIKNFSEHYK
ncbi:MAG: DUF2683 family protein [Nanoarchaeota archaeon]